MRRSTLMSLLLGAALAGCSEKPAAPGSAAGEPQTADVTLVDIQRGPLRRTVNVTGTLFGDEQATISAKVSGRIARIVADVGDRVGSGQPLAFIDPTDYELTLEQREMSVAEALARLGLDAMPDESFDVSTVATVERARFQAANAQARLDRARKLFEQRPPLISEQDFADIETAYQVAERDQRVALLEARSLLAQARKLAVDSATAGQRLADTTIRAPLTASDDSSAATQSVTGNPQRYAVSQRLISVGEYVREGDPLFHVVADDPVKFRGNVPERFVSELAVGQVMMLSVDGYVDPFEGTISRINPAIDVASRSFQIEALIPNGHGKLRPGAFGVAVVRVGQDDNVVFVPPSAIYSFAGLERIYTVKDGKAQRHVITRQSEVDGLVALRETLDGHTQVVATGADRLANGMAVNVVSADNVATAEPAALVQP